MTINDIRKAIVAIKSLKDAKVYMELIHYARTETGGKNGERNIVILSPQIRSNIAAITGVGRNNIPKHLASLRALGLIGGERNDYVLKKPFVYKEKTETEI